MTDTKVQNLFNHATSDMIFAGPARINEKRQVLSNLPPSCGIVTNYRTFLEGFLSVEEFCRWLDEWGE